MVSILGLALLWVLSCVVWVNDGAVAVGTAQVLGQASLAQDAINAQYPVPPSPAFKQVAHCGGDDCQKDQETDKALCQHKDTEIASLMAALRAATPGMSQEAILSLVYQILNDEQKRPVNHKAGCAGQYTYEEPPIL